MARDENVKRLKGRKPDHEEGSGAHAKSLRYCTKSAAGIRGANLLEVVRDIGPNIIALGYDQGRPPGLETTFQIVK